MRLSSAIVTGVCGQDGSYLAEQLLEAGCHVIGAVRNANAAGSRLPPATASRIEFIDWDAADAQRIEAQIAQYQPAAVFNLAAHAVGSRMFDDPVSLTDTNGMAVARLLEAVRRARPATRICQASSSEMFGDTLESPQSETTAFRPRSPYGAAKLFAHNMIGIYRRRYGLHASSAILYNHESPRRSEEFVLPSIARGAARISLGIADHLRVGNLDARRDWGYAPDYVRAMVQMACRDEADDYVICSGRLHSVRDVCSIAFGHFGLDYRDYVRTDPALFRENEAVPLVGNCAKAESRLGLAASIDLTGIIGEIITDELSKQRSRP